MTDGSGGGGLRAALGAYVRALHEAYLRGDPNGDGDVSAVPLAEAPFTVAVVAADRLHLLATRDPLPAELPHEQPIDDALGPLQWRVRFLDASVVPALGDPPGADGIDVPAVLGVGSSLYHLIVELDASLTEHHAMHAGTGLAHAHRRQAGR